MLKIVSIFVVLVIISESVSDVRDDCVNVPEIKKNLRSDFNERIFYLACLFSFLGTFCLYTNWIFDVKRVKSGRKSVRFNKYLKNRKLLNLRESRRRLKKFISSKGNKSLSCLKVYILIPTRLKVYFSNTTCLTSHIYLKNIVAVYHTVTVIVIS